MKPLCRKDRVFEALTGQRTAHDIAYAINESPVDVSNALCKLRDAGKVRVARTEKVSKKAAAAANVWERA